MTLSVIIPTLNGAQHLQKTVHALGRVDQLIVVDGGSHDRTTPIAEGLGAQVIKTEAGRGRQLMAGAAAATGSWLLFLHADTQLDENWRDLATQFMAQPEHRQAAAVFRFALDDSSPQARRLERWVAWRVQQLGLPYGDQGLLIHRDFYRLLGGFQPLPLMEDVDIVRRIGRRRLHVLNAAAKTSAARWHKGGWWRRSARNLGCLSLYFLGVPPHVLKRLYG